MSIIPHRLILCLSENRVLRGEKIDRCKHLLRTSDFGLPISFFYLTLSQNTIMETFRSDLSNNEFPIADRVSAKTIRQHIFKMIQKEYPKFSRDSYISRSEMNLFREKYISEYIIKEIGELSDLEKKVLDSLVNNSTLSDKIEDEAQTLTIGQKIADKVASFGGSWTFIISFGIFITIWISLNALWLAHKGFDPYPFILLNLILSCIAALQAPVIMMSQNRQEEKDRQRARKDYMINLKSELEIRTLHEKIDHFIIYQQQELLEIQKVQVEMMTDILKQIEKEKS